MSVSSLRCSWRRVLAHAASGLQAELRRSPVAPPAALPSLLSCLRPASHDAAAGPANALLRCRLLSTQSTSPAAQTASALQPDGASAAGAAEPSSEAGVAAAAPGVAVPASGAAPLPPRGGVGGHKPGGLVDREVPLLDWAGAMTGTTVLPGAAFDVAVRRDILQRVVRWQLAKRQQGTHKAKTRREVAGGGRKPFNQKGTGRARQGTIRAPHMRGGGKAHGPVVRSHEHSLQRKVRQMGLRCVLSAKAAEGRLMIMDSLAVEEPKTRALDVGLSTLLEGAPRRSVLLVDSAKDGADGGGVLRRCASNLPWVDVLPVAGANVYSMLQRDYLLVSRDALAALVDRATRPIRRRRLVLGETPQENVTAALSHLGIRADVRQ